MTWQPGHPMHAPCMHRYETHLKLAKEAFGTNSFRFSFEWSRLEPGGPGQVDETAVERCAFGTWAACSHVGVKRHPDCF